MADEVQFGETDEVLSFHRNMTDGTVGPDRGVADNVVTLSDMAREARFPMLGQIEAYWNELRGNRLVPARTDVDPRRIEDLLEYAFILERIAPGMARFRLAGMHLNDLMGMEVRGMPLTAFFDPEARTTVSAALERVFTEPAIATLTLKGERGIGRPALEGRLLLLPLKSDFGEVSRVLGCLVTLGPVGRTPRRFQVTGERIRPILGAAGEARRRTDMAGWGADAAVRPRRPIRDTSLPLRDRPLSVDPTDPRQTLHRVETPDAGTGAQGISASRPPRAEGRPHLYLVKSDED
jgi:hypothetical protein